MKNFGVKPYLFPMPVYMIGTYNEDGTVELYYTASDTSTPTQTTNKNDYAKVFGNYALTADDAELPIYGEAIALNALIILCILRQYSLLLPPITYADDTL